MCARKSIPGSLTWKQTAPKMDLGFARGKWPSKIGKVAQNPHLLAFPGEAEIHFWATVLLFQTGVRPPGIAGTARTDVLGESGRQVHLFCQRVCQHPHPQLFGFSQKGSGTHCRTSREWRLLVSLLLTQNFKGRHKSGACLDVASSLRAETT